MEFPKRVQSLVEETSETVSSAPHRLMQASRGALDMTREEAEHLIARGEDIFEKLVERGQKIEEVQGARLHEWFKSWSNRGRRQMHEAEEQLEVQVRGALRALHIPSAEEVAKLDKEIERIGRKLNDYLAHAQQAGLPISGYADMTIKEITPLLEGMNREQLMAIRDFEVAHSDRVTLLREIDSKLEDLEAESTAV